MASDSFTNSDSTGLESHDSNWGSYTATFVVTALEINSNICEPETDYTNSGARYTTSSEDLSQIVKKSGSYINNSAGVCVRTDGTNGCYAFRMNGLSTDTFSSCELVKDFTFLAGGSGSWSRLSDRTLKITASGSSTTTVKGFIDGSEEATYDDSTTPYTSGSPGFYCTSGIAAADAGFDDWTDGASGTIALPLLNHSNNGGF